MRAARLLLVPTLLLALSFGLQALAQEVTPSASPSPAPDEAPDEPEPAPEGQSNPASVALGGLSGMTAFMTCGYLGGLAEDLERGRPSAEVEARASAVARGLIVNVRQVEAVGAQGGMTPAAEGQLAGLRRLLGALVEQAKSLELYAATQEPSVAEGYRELRGRTWTETSRLLGLSEAAAASLAPGGATLGAKASGEPR